MTANHTPAENENSQVQVRKAFVGMLFALAVSQVAIGVVEYVEVESWWRRYDVALHLVLALVVIASSWVDWSRSLAPGNVKPVTSIRSWLFAVLLVDVALVINYFYIAQTAIAPSSDNLMKFRTPSAIQEAIGVVVMCGLFALWNIFARVVCVSNQQSKWPKLLFLGASVYASSRGVACALIAFIVYREAVQYDTEIVGVAICDMALIGVVLLYRGLRELHKSRGRWFFGETEYGKAYI